MNKKLLLVGIAFTLGFSSCTATPPPPGLGGTLTAPAGTDLKGTIVIACNIETCTAASRGTADVVTVTTNGLSTKWNILLAAHGKFRVFAVNAEQGLTGFYKNPVDSTNIIDSSHYSISFDINISMQKATVPAQALDLLNATLPNP